MNQDFVLNASPSVARRLVKVAKISNVVLDPEIERISGENLLKAEDYPHLTPAQLGAVQEIMDCEGRCILSANPTLNDNGGCVETAFERLVPVIAEAIKLLGNGPVGLRCAPVTPWVKAFARYSLDTHPLTTDTDVFNYELIRDIRRGVLIANMMNRGTEFLASDFKRSIFVLPNQPTTDNLVEYAATLFPNGPWSVTESNYLTQVRLSEKGFTVADMSALVNIIKLQNN